MYAIFKAISRKHNNNNLYSTFEIEFMHILRITIDLSIPGVYSSRSRHSKPSLPGCQIRRHLRFLAIVHFLRICVVPFFSAELWVTSPPPSGYAYGL